MKKPNGTAFVLYRRVSSREQGASGLGLAAQLRDCELYLASQTGAVTLGDFIEVTSGAKSERPQLKAALALCRQSGAKLLVAKLDRLSRVVSEIALLMDDKSVDFVVARFPQASRFELHLYAALAEQERQFISQRTKAALAVAKSRGVKLGGARQHLENHNAQQSRLLELEAKAIAPFVLPLREKGASLRQVAQTLNEFGLKTRRGSRWHHSRVAEICHFLKRKANL
ncbi:MAG: DNA invertase [Betaproteobacteria bacterium]|nr:DNA invertase [Betaproteobacteria bacterium]